MKLRQMLFVVMLGMSTQSGFGGEEQKVQPSQGWVERAGSYMSAAKRKAAQAAAHTYQEMIQRPYTAATTMANKGYEAIKMKALDLLYTNKSREEKIAEIKKILEGELSDSVVYPTRSSKVNALLKKNEFSFGAVQGVGGVFDEACRQLIQEIMQEAEGASEAAIGQAISTLNAQLALLSLAGRIHYMEQRFKSPKAKAYLSVLFRLKKQQAFEKLTGQKTSPEKFYQLPKEQAEELKSVYTEKTGVLNEELRQRASKAQAEENKIPQ